MAAARNAVVLVTDEKIFPAAMFAAHRLATLNPRADTDVIVFSNAWQEMKAAATMSLPFRLVPMIFPPGANLHPTFFRLFAPDILQDEYSRILYIDVDTYAESAAPFALFDLDMEGKVIAAVRDCFVAFGRDKRERETILRGRHDKYFNGGVLLIDGERYVANGTLAKLAKIIPRMLTADHYFDQSSLNMLLDGDWLELSPAFNMFLAAWNDGLGRAFPPAITHFPGSQKPWHGPRFASAHPARAAAEAFLLASPWKGFLARFFSVRDSLSFKPGSVPIFHLSWSLTEDSPYVRYLRETRFADVVAGITAMDLAKLAPA